MNLLKLARHVFTALAFAIISLTTQAMSKPQPTDFSDRPIELPQPPAQIFWHEIGLNSQSFCSSTFISKLMETGDFLQMGTRHPSDILQPIMRQTYLSWSPYVNLAPDLVAYDPSGNCRIINGKNTGSLTFGAQPSEDGIGAGLYIFSGIEERTILSASYFAISSDPSRGPWVKAKVNFEFNNTLPDNIVADSEKYFHIQLRYLNQDGVWRLGRRAKIGSGTAKEVTFQLRLRYDTLVELQILTPSELYIMRNDHELANLYGDYIFPTIYNFSLQTETCVPDLISGECLE